MANPISVSLSNLQVRRAALRALGTLTPAALEMHAGTICQHLEKDFSRGVRHAAACVLGMLDPATLARHAGSVALRLDDSNRWGFM